MRRRSLGGALLLSLILGLANGVLAQQTSENHHNRPSVAIIDFFPFGYYDKKGEPKGMFIDIAQALSRHMGVPFDLHLLPVPRALRGVSSGAIDMLISYKDPLMVPNVEFIGKVGCLSSMLVPSADYHPQSLEQLDEMKVGYITGGYFDKRFSQELNIVPIEVPSNEGMLNMLMRGRLDAIVVNDAVFNAYLADMNPNYVLPPSWRTRIGSAFLIETMETHLSMSDHSPFQWMKPKISSAVQELSDAGKLLPIYRKYNSSEEQECRN